MGVTYLNRIEHVKPTQVSDTQLACCSPTLRIILHCTIQLNQRG